MFLSSAFFRSSFLASALCLCVIWPSSGRTYKVRGNTGADIQAQIDKAFAKGGGKVVVPAGVYDVGSIQLKSNVELHLKNDALLLVTGSSFSTLQA